jgi:hypothetical protein
MRNAVIAGVASALLTGLGIEVRAEDYITGVLGNQLEIYQGDDARPVHVVDAAMVTEPIRVTEAIDEVWLEIVVDGEYYRVRREKVQVSRATPSRDTAMKPAAGQGARLGFGGH